MSIMSKFFRPNIKKFKTEKNVKGLIKALRYKKDEHLRSSASIALMGVKGPRAVDLLIDALLVDDSNTRQTAARVLGKIGDSRAVDPLINILMDDDRETRRAVASALGKIGDSRAVDPLIDAFKKKHEAWTAEALGVMGDSRAVDPLIDDLKEKMERDRAAANDQRMKTARAAAEALGKIGAPQAVDALIAIFKPWEHYSEGEENNLRLLRDAAAHALSQMGSPAIGPLVDILKREVERASITNWASHKGTSFVARAELSRAAQVRSLVTMALGEITGKRFGKDTDRWQKWWEEQQ